MRTMSGLQPKEVTSSFVSQPVEPVEISHPADQSASDIAVKHIQEMMKGAQTKKKDWTLSFPGPISQGAPVPQQPIKKAQLESAPKELSEKEKKEQEEAALEAMTSIEDRQNNAIKKSMIS